MFKKKLFQAFVINRSTYSTNVRVRFAPSPTGNLHIGGLRVAFYNYLFAKKHNGKFLLRIEDTDRERFKPDSVSNLIESLKWTNITPDDGPGFSINEQDAHEYYQSNRLEHYKKYSQHLIDKGLAYKCYCDEKRLELLKRNALKNKEKQAYDGKCRHLTQKKIEENTQQNLKYVIRFKLDDKLIDFNDIVFGSNKIHLYEQEGDFVLIKSDGFPVYHFANVVDDHLMKITHVLRGQEWLTSTPKHIALYQAFDWVPPQYAHLPLIMNNDGSKLSKRNQDMSVLSYRDRGYLPGAIISYLTTFGGGFQLNNPNDNTELDTKSLKELVNLFDLKHIVKRPVKYNQETLLNINKKHLLIKLKSNQKFDLISQLRHLLINFKFKSNETHPIDPYYLSDDYLNFVLNLTENRIQKSNDLLDTSYDYLWYNYNKNDLIKLINEKFSKQLTSNVHILYLIEVFMSYVQVSKFGDTGDEAEAKKAKANMETQLKLIKTKFKAEFKCEDSIDKLNLWLFYRIILCGNMNGPPIVEIIQLLGKNNVLHRLNNIKKIFELK